MSDSAALLQNSAVANKVGLARHRPLAINTNPKDAKSKSSLPDGWYFNETKENEFWEDIEKSSGDQSLPVVTPKNESKPSIQESTIEDLKKKIQDLQNKIQKQNEISEDLQKKLNQTEEEKEELSTSIQKHLQNLVDERTKALSSNKNINDQSTTNRSELYELQMKHQNEIREINNIHRQEIFQVQELSRKKLSQERERILKEIGDGNSQALIKSISDEAEKQIEELKKEFETQRQNIIEEWAGKVTLLTRQYENRIKTLNSQHEMDLIMKKDDINSEITSKKIQIENEFNEKVLKLNEENNKIINEYENQITKINNNLQNKKIENQNLKKQLGIETNENDEVEEDKNDNNIIQKQIIKNDNFKEFEDYAMKYKIMKDEMEEQSNWALKNQKRYYKKKIEKVATDAQKQMREKLMEIQEKMLEMKNDENPKNKIEDLINDVSNTFEGMNNTIEEVVNDLNENEPTIPIKESNERIEELRNKIIELRNEIQTLKNENKNINNNVKQSKENEIKKTKLTKKRTEIKQIDESALKTQLDNMNEIFNNITNDNKVIDIKQLKEQISNMKTIIETTQAQRDMYKAQAEDNEISLTKAEDSILVLKNQINELIQNDEINSKNYNSKDIEQIFNDVELKKLRYEREQDLKKGQEQNKEMEKTLAQNIQLVTRNMELEKEITKLQNEHQKALNTIEEMSIQNSLFKNPIDNEIPSKDTSDKCIQCNFVKDKEEINEVQTITKNQKENSPRKTKNSSTKNQNNFEKEIIKQQNIQNDKEEELINDKLEENENKNQKIDEIIEPIQNEENNLLQNDKSTEITSDINIKQEEQNDIQQQNSQINLNNINNSEEIDDFDQSFETFSTNIEKIMNDLTPQNFEIVPHTVHQPLQWSKKKKLRIPTISDNKNPQSKTPKTQLRLKHPPSLHNNTNNNKDNENIDQSLTIGGAKQGQRQIRGVHGNIKPLRTSMQLINYENQTEATKQNIENLPDILSSYTQNININNNNNERTSSPVHATTNANALSPAHTTTNANASSPAHVTTNSKNVDVPPLVPGSLEANPPAPLRITLVVHQNQVVKEKKPIVIPPNEAQTTTKPIQSVSGTILRQQQIINSTSNEALKAITKLKDQIHKLQEINEKKDSNIIELREKVNDLMINNHRLKVDNIKHIDDLKRSEIHCENLKSRLDICFKELISRDEEIKQLKRQILLLKNYTLPVTKSINNINNVNKEKERIKKEKLQRLNITKMTENALKETENEELKSHLNLILRNQQLSIKKLEEQRKMWSEIEKKNLMAVLSSMSLLSDSNYDKIINNLPKNSPFKSSRVNAMDFVKRINKISFNGEEEDLEEFDNLNDDNKRKQVMPYTKKLELIGKANKEQLDDGKIKDIVERKDSHEVQKVLMEIEHKDKEENRLKNELIRPT
ncbi:hypothetical protein GPJ56_010041 [Histomonas meleagridis]|uniref:uncharacterized protein n=1 Tax=Histomonas meleagridis TaxID=135588 RepID=UPI00355A1816|nr:hypothetical protein GPJ56_010041 [Histomonas meleagridis]KAH0799517.1 hypothetical protein GO595_007712 [Histomonas meleagridis]